MITPRELQAMYKRGENLSMALRQSAGTDRNTEEIIEWSYDIQAGSYVKAMRSPEFATHKQKYTTEIACRLRSLALAHSVLEAGVGEATTLSGVLRNLNMPGLSAYGFDLSWSRLAYAQQHLDAQGIKDVMLCTGSLFNIPFLSNSIDIVYTSHSIEPNGGQEEPILRELYRVARRWLVLLEPGYELANAESRRRMASHGYCRDLVGTAKSLGYEIVQHDLFPFSANPSNPTSWTVIKKNDELPSVKNVLACPRCKTPLEMRGDVYYSPESLTVYPIIKGIPCLRVENGIVASHFLTF